MRKLTFAVLATVLFFTACSKDDDKNTTTPNGFTFNDTTAVTNNGYLFDYGSDGLSLAFTDSALTTTYNGKLNAVGFDIDTLISGKTYTYLSHSSEGYDKTKNFSDGYAYFGVNWADGKIINTTGRAFENITSGSITYTKNGDNYSFTYTFQFPVTKLTGTFNGKVEIRKQD